MLIFLFLSCDGGKKTPESVVSDEDFDQDIDIEDDDDEEFVEDEDADTDTKPDKDSDKPENDKDIEPVSDPCQPNLCWDIGGTGECIPDEEASRGYICVCREHKTWTGNYCKDDINEVECTGLPDHAHWTVSEICEQTWRENFEGEGEWYPSPEGRYGWEQKAECYFLCDENYFWNGSKCVNLCENEPCKDVPHSDGVCSSVGAEIYTCGCDEGYYWWGEKLGCTMRKPALGNVCTGQNECYDNSVEIECPTDPDAAFFGQDAHYAKLGTCSPLDITVDSSNSDEPLVINRNTGLMWQTKIAEESFTWENAVKHCEELTYSGYDDWRLPSVQELMSIIVSNKYMIEYNRIFFNFFPEYVAQSSNFVFFWTSDLAVYAYDYAWYLTFYNNKIEAGSKSDSRFAVCVRGEKLPEPEFEVSEINGDEVVTDSTTGLMWQKNYGTKTLWEQALYYCEHLVYAGYSDWRLPNRNELLSLVDYNKSSPASSFPGIYPSTSDVYSSTSQFYGIGADGIFGGSGNMFSIYFHYGYALLNPKANMYRYYDEPVYCVRSEVCPENQFLRGSECIENPCRAEFCEVSNSTGDCIPKSETDYECGCLEGFFWNGSECVNPCDANPCSEIANSNGRCSATGASSYYCGCTEGYTWTSGKCDTFAEGVKTVGNICTGQTECYNTASCSISESAPFSGQDAAFAAAGTCLKQDFTVKTVANRNIVIDNNTKLEWQQEYPQKPLGWNDAYAYCDSLEYGGKNDWRLPASHELLTIVNIGQLWAMADRNYFTEIPERPTDGRNFWSEEASLLDIYEGWTVFYPEKDDVYFVMCVRGKKLPKANLSVSTLGGREIVKDSTTGLSWTIETFSTEKWKDALSHCMKSTYANHKQWRLPNKNELASLIGFDERTAPGFYGISWSSTTYQHRGEYVVDVSPGGRFDYSLKDYDNYQVSGTSRSVICVGNLE